MMPGKRKHICDTFTGADLTNSIGCEQVKVHIWKDYGSLIITVTDEGNIVLDAVDGEGKVLNTACIDPEEHCEVEEEPEEEENCDECGGDLEYIETKANGDLCRCCNCGHEQMTASEEEEDDE